MVSLQKDVYYQVYVQLKDNYHKKFEQATKRSIGKFFAITYQANILANRLPVINSKITGGRFTIELFDKRGQAATIKHQITGEDR